MPKVIVTAPDTDPYELQDLMSHLRLDADDEGNKVERLGKAARSFIELTILNRALITQTWDLWRDTWPGSYEIKLPLPPLQSVGSVKYYDIDDVEDTFAASKYFVDTKSAPGRLVLNDGESWATTTLRPANGLAIQFVAGYGSSADDVPDTIKEAIFMLAAHWYENREGMGEVPDVINNMLADFRIQPI